MRYQANTRYHSIRWILAYAGIFFLGFGGSRSTSEMAINYYKTVRGRGIAVCHGAVGRHRQNATAFRDSK